MLLVYLLFALDMLNMSLFIPVFGRHVMSLGGSHFFLGLIGSCNAFISLFWKPIAGSLSDTKGTRIVLIWCLTTCLFGYILAVGFKSLFIFFVGRMFCAFGTPIQTLLRTIVTSLAGESDKISEIFNKIGMLMAVCLMGGALVSGFISEYENGIYYVWFIMAANTLISIVLASFLPKQVTSKANELTAYESAKQELKTAVSNLKDVSWRDYWDIFSIKGSLDLSYGVMQSNMGIILLTIFKAEGRHMGYVITLVGIASIVSNVLMLKLNKSLYVNDKGYTRIIHGTSLLVLSYLGLGLSSVYAIFVCFVLTMSASRSLLESTLNELLNSKVKSNEKGKINSIFDSILSLTELVAPMLSSLVASLYGVQYTVLLCSIPALIGTVIAYGQKHDYFKSIPSKAVKTD